MVERVTTNPIGPLFDRHTIATQVAEKILVDNPPKSNCPLELRQENQMNSIKNTISIVATAALLATPIAAADTIKVGVLHSLSGTLAISETTLKETMELLIEEQNKKGGILGKQLEAVVVDPASDWPLFAEKARELLTVAEVDVIFGCWTSVSRKSVLPVIEEVNGLLFFPVHYDG